MIAKCQTSRRLIVDRYRNFSLSFLLTLFKILNASRINCDAACAANNDKVVLFHENLLFAADHVQRYDRGKNNIDRFHISRKLP